MTDGDPYLVIEGAATKQKSSQVGPAAALSIVARGADGKIAVDDMPAGIGPDTQSIVASEALAANDLVNIHTVTGSARARKADGSTTGKPADGFVLASVLAAGTATVYRRGANSGYSGLTDGAHYYLSPSVPGGVSTTPAAASGQTWQYVGVATSDTVIEFQSGQPVEFDL